VGRRKRDQLTSFVLLPAVLIAVGIVAYFTFRTALFIDQLRQQSVLEATLGLATEKANRLDRQIIDQDNVVGSVADLGALSELPERWLPTAQRETPSVRAILVLGEDKSVLAFASRAGSAWGEEEAFRRLLVERMLPDLDLPGQPQDELRHLHREYNHQSYLVSYWQKVWNGHHYLVVAWHDIGRIVKDTLPTLYAESRAGSRLPKEIENFGPSRVNVVDEEGRIIFGPPLRNGEFTVGVKFPTTLYNWRLQVSPAGSEELASRVKNRRLLEIALVALSCLVIVAGVATILFAAERERRVSALKSDFVANVSHELKTPLAVVRMFAEMLQSGRVTSPEKQSEYISVIVRESERLSSLIENVLDFAKVERGRGSYEFAEADVSDVVGRAVDVCRYRAERDGIELVFEGAKAEVRAKIDERAIQLAVINLVDNALKYAPLGKTITVRVTDDPSVITIRVSDQGPGVPVDERVRIFERFVRGEGAKPHDGRSPVRGSGIGLALVKHIAESHGGRAWVESASVSGASSGSSFCLTVARRLSPTRNET